jgi:hypothetical protein
LGKKRERHVQKHAGESDILDLLVEPDLTEKVGVGGAEEVSDIKRGQLCFGFFLSLNEVGRRSENTSKVDESRKDEVQVFAIWREISDYEANFTVLRRDFRILIRFTIPSLLSKRSSYP